MGGVRQKNQKQKSEFVLHIGEIKKLKPFAPIVFNTVNPINDVEEYVESKQVTSMHCREPNPDIVGREAIKLISSRRLLHHANNRLENIREISKERRKDLDKEWNVVTGLQELLRGSMISFNTFIKENMEKRERAVKKVGEERALQSVRQGNIDALMYEANRLHEIKKVFDTNIRLFKMYENYLQKVVNISEFKDIGKLMLRFDALQEAKTTSYDASERNLKMLEDNMVAMSRMHEEKGFVIIGLKNRVSDLQIRFGCASQNALLWETIVSSVKDHCSVLLMQKNKVKDVSKNLYEMMCRRKMQKATLPDHDYERKMIAIGKTLGQMEKIMTMIKGKKTIH